MTVDYLDLDDLLLAAEYAMGGRPVVRDAGLLESALHRPQATWYGADTYPELDTKAAALLLSLVGNHALVDGNKRLGWVGVNLFYGLNGHELSAPEDDAYDLVVANATGDVDDVDKVATTLRSWRV